MTTPIVQQCAVTTCSFNAGGCNAQAMTMGRSGCVTFVELGVRGGSTGTEAHVGACQKADCTFNHNLECGASSVEVGADGAECLTYRVA